MTRHLKLKSKDAAGLEEFLRSLRSALGKNRRAHRYRNPVDLFPFPLEHGVLVAAFVAEEIFLKQHEEFSFLETVEKEGVPL